MSPLHGIPNSKTALADSPKMAAAVSAIAFGMLALWSSAVELGYLRGVWFGVLWFGTPDVEKQPMSRPSSHESPV